MATTVLDVAQSEYAIHVRDTHLHCRDSVPTVGLVKEGRGVWCVVRGGAIVPDSIEFGPLNYHYPLQHDDEVWCEFLDRDGNRGGWQTHTAVVTGTINHYQYVDTAGSDANDGLTSGTAVATAYQARLNMEALLTANQVGTILYKAGQVHLFTTAQTPWAGASLGIKVRCIFDRYGAGARPILRRSVSDNTAYTAIRCGKLDSVHVRNLEIEGLQPATYNADQVAVEVFRDGAGARNPLNLLLENIRFHGFSVTVGIADTAMDETRRLAGEGDFLCKVDCSFENAGGFHVYDNLCARYVGLKNVAYGKTNGQAGPNIFRISNWSEVHGRNVTWAPENVGSFRFQLGRDPTDNNLINGAENITFVDCAFYGTDRALSVVGFGGKAPRHPSDAYCSGIRLINFRTHNCGLGIGGATNFTDIQVWNCSIGGQLNLMTGSDISGVTTAVMDGFEFIDSTISMSSDAGGTGPLPTIRCNAKSPTAYADGGIKLRGVTALWAAETPGYYRSFIYFGFIEDFDAHPKIDSDYNHIAFAGTGANVWLDAGFNIEDPLAIPPIPLGSKQDLYDLPAWRTLSGEDTHSTDRSNSTLDVVNPGTHATNQIDMDLAYATGSGPVNNLGWPRAHSLDGLGYVRSVSAPDPGPFEFGATVQPALPSLAPPETVFGVGILGFEAFGQGSEVVTPPIDGPGVQLANTSANDFFGWLTINTDLPMLAFGQLAAVDSTGATQTVQVVRGAVTSIDTRRADLLVSLPAGATLYMPSLLATTTDPVPSAIVDPDDFFSGKPTIGGIAMDLHSQATEGAATVSEWRLRNGVWMVYLWTSWVPGEPWVRAEAAILHSNPTTPDLAAAWPGWKLDWGNGLVETLGLGTNGDLTVAGRNFGDGQCQVLPVICYWPTRYRGARDLESVEALRTFGVMGHGIQRLLNDGNPYQTPLSTTWGAGALPGAIERLHNSAVSPHNILPDPGPSGSQADQFFVREEPLFDVSATLPTYLEACRWGAKPCHFVEVDGDPLDLVARPGFRAFDGRPHPPTSQNEPGQPGTALLGKPGPLNPGEHTPVTGGDPGSGWNGPGWEHWLINGLTAATRYTGSRALQWKLGLHANLYLASRFPDTSFGLSNAAIFSTRGILYEAANCVHWYRELADRTLAAAIRTRFQLRAASVIGPWINPTHGYPVDYWQVYTDPTASVTNLPGYIPWQQGPTAYFLDLASRVMGGLSSLTAGIAAGAARVLEDVWNFEGGRWVEYERQQLPAPFGDGIEERSGDFAVSWFPPLVAYILRYDGGNSKALQIWQQMLGDTAAGLRKWMPPLMLAPPSGGGPFPIPFEEPFIQGNALGLLGLLGSGSATVASGATDANGIGSLGFLLAGVGFSDPPDVNSFGNGLLGFLLDGSATAPVSGYGGLLIEFLGHGVGTLFNPNGPGVPPTGGGGVEPCPTLWAATKASYDEDGLIALTNVRDRAATTINDLAGENAAAGVASLWPVYAQEPFDNCNPTHIEVGKRAVIAMLWARGGTAATIAKVEWDEVFSPEGMISKVRRTGARGRMAPRTNSDVRSARPTEAYLGWADPEALPPGILPNRWRLNQ